MPPHHVGLVAKDLFVDCDSLWVEPTTLVGLCNDRELFDGVGDVSSTGEEFSDLLAHPKILRVVFQDCVVLLKRSV